MKEPILDRPMTVPIRLNWEKTAYLILIILALVTRLWGLGERVQSHDESIHTKYSWNLYAGHGFQHNPLMHGPFLFHATALSYFLFSDNDFTARLPVALMGVLIVAFPYLLRRWLGRVGALATSFFLLISPSIAYHSRYVRHDVPVILWALVVVLALLSYLQNGHRRWLYLLGAGVSLMFATKEVAFIYNAIFGLFLVGLFLLQVLDREWPNKPVKPWFLACVAVVAIGILAPSLAIILQRFGWITDRIAFITRDGGIIVAGAGLLAGIGCLVAGHLRRQDLAFPQVVPALVAAVFIVGVVFRVGLPAAVSSSPCMEQDLGGRELSGCVRTGLLEFQWPEGRHVLSGGLFPDGIYVDAQLVLSLLPFVGAATVALAWLALTAFRSDRRFDLIVFLGTLCLPFLSPILIVLANLDPVAYARPAILYSAAIAVQAVLTSIAIGLLWDLRQHADERRSYQWLTAAAISYAIFVILFTTVFTSGQGIGTGLVGSLGYWLAQQEVERGSQPWYYYLVTVSLYEYLPLLLSLVAPAYLAVRAWLLPHIQPGVSRLTDSPALKERFVPLVLWWVALSWAGYSAAGERMPWLTTHLALPMILLSGWLVGRWLEGTDWQQVLKRQGWLVPLVVVPFVMALLMLGGAIRSGAFQGQELAQLYATGQLLGSAVGVLVFGAGLAYAVYRSGWRIALRIALLLLLLPPILLTVRHAWRFCYVNYDFPTEFLVYAHAAPGVREVMSQIDELSRRTAGGANLIQVSYGEDGRTLWDWQLRNYPNAVCFFTSPSRENMDVPVIIAGSGDWEGVRPYVAQDYTFNEYTYLWWPMQDYWNLTAERIRYAVTNPDMRAALWDIWYDRDYRKYDEVTEKAHTLDQWPLRSDFRLYIRRDTLAQIWELSTLGPREVPELADPYAERHQPLTARLVFGESGSEPGQLESPRGIKVGPDGYIYVADAGNDRIQKFSTDGDFVAAWDGRTAPDSPSIFLEPWDVALARDGTVYVADTWNHRIQKLDANGNPITVWGTFGQHTSAGTGGSGAFYGPRGIAVGPDGEVYVADTGNKRVQVFSPEGDYLHQWGGGGVLEGYLDEPVGIAVGQDGNVYVADTWNRRVQVFSSAGQYLRDWPIEGWDAGLAEEKPYLAVDGQGYVYVTDPGYYRVLVFDALGNYVLSFGQYGLDESSFALPVGIAVAEDGSIYVTDAPGGRVLVFDPPHFAPLPEPDAPG